MDTDIPVLRSYKEAALRLEQVHSDPGLQEEFYEASLQLAVVMGETFAAQKPKPSSLKEVGDMLSPNLRLHFLEGVAREYTSQLEAGSLAQGERLRIMAMCRTAQRSRDRLAENLATAP